ncbi:Conserved protein mycobacteriophage D29, Gp61 (DUF2493) [Pacmanvirus A23]|uniref:Conserved protein mycobacteriophage D29, Gp61 (DUF2493) n=1 Tax=Pacmanvirus A23 TaxID=1932881 RepID=UPI000A0964A4|nr:Conserved protein mycobacteriophage D29, Gp61 (DUF2493) [Pacmanvirus A23]SIP85845.1 Conserved protein mycobacteriophage D29, Gp61 (DUF2493) [Pacmanvirus A23]
MMSSNLNYIMKVAVMGSRTFDNYELLCIELDKLEITEIISGGAFGADSLAEQYAGDCDLPTTIFKPDWDRYGRKLAGIIRNSDIVANCDILIAFWDRKSNGTRDSINKAKAANKLYKIVIFKN